MKQNYDKQKPPAKQFNSGTAKELFHCDTQEQEERMKSCLVTLAWAESEAMGGQSNPCDWHLNKRQAVYEYVLTILKSKLSHKPTNGLLKKFSYWLGCKTGVIKPAELSFDVADPKIDCDTAVLLTGLGFTPKMKKLTIVTNQE